MIFGFNIWCYVKVLKIPEYLLRNFYGIKVYRYFDTSKFYYVFFT
jgi:hypothetical protein